MNVSGVAFFYNSENPKAIIRDFERTIDKKMSPGDRDKALKHFMKRLSHAHEVLFQEKFKGPMELLNSALEEKGMKPAL